MSATNCSYGQIGREVLAVFEESTGKLTTRDVWNRLPHFSLQQVAQRVTILKSKKVIREVETQGVTGFYQYDHRQKKRSDRTMVIGPVPPTLVVIPSNDGKLSLPNEYVRERNNCGAGNASCGYWTGNPCVRFNKYQVIFNDVCFKLFGIEYNDVFDIIKHPKVGVPTHIWFRRVGTREDFSNTAVDINKTGFYFMRKREGKAHENEESAPTFAGALEAGSSDTFITVVANYPGLLGLLMRLNRANDTNGDLTLVGELTPLGVDAGCFYPHHMTTYAALEQVVTEEQFQWEKSLRKRK